MRAEGYCATRIQFLEGERFLEVAKQKPGRKFPDLVSKTPEGKYRLREVKFKLEERLVRKALAQLEAAATDYAKLDRLELVIALEGRRLKPPELPFVGEPLANFRYVLLLDGRPCSISGIPVTLLLL